MAINTKPRRIVCAAVRAASGEILLGIRHYDKEMSTQICMRVDGYLFQHRYGNDQGFVDQFGAYLTRSEAYLIAKAASQVRYPEACGEGPHGPELYSLGLY